LLLCGPAFARASSPQSSYGGASITAESPVAAKSPGVRGVQLTISTPAFSAPTHVQVFLPAGYDTDPTRRWPVTYYLHGTGGDPTRFNAWYGDLIGGFPSIFVSPDGGLSGYYSDWYNAGSGGPPMYESYDIDQLIPLIDSYFRTIASRAGRAVIGESMGGYGVMTYAVRHPDLFGAAVSMSGFVDSNYVPEIALISGGPLVQTALPDSIYGPRATQEVRWHGHNPTDLADNLRGVDLQVRTGEGTPTEVGDPTNPTSAVACVEEAGIYKTSVDFHQALLADGIPHVWQDYGPTCHGPDEFRREFTDSLPGLASDFAQPRPAPRTFDYGSVEPQFTIWGWRVDADPSRALEFLQMRGAGRNGLTLIGSGNTSVTTPPFFHGRQAVDVISPDGTITVTPDDAGRLHFTVDLGHPHTNQQYTPASELAGDGNPGYFTTVTVRFVPHG
jgi:S-formylglutathione hydrolase FrmB